MSLMYVKEGKEAEKRIPAEFRTGLEKVLYGVCAEPVGPDETAAGVACGWSSETKKGETVLVFASSFADRAEAEVKLKIIAEILTMSALDCLKMELVRRVLNGAVDTTPTDELEEAGDDAVVH